MSALLVVIAAAGLAGAPGGALGRAATDTAVAVQRGDELVVETPGGRILVEGWDEERVSVVGGEGVALERRSGRIGLTPRGRHREGVGEVRLHVPRWMAVTLTGHELDAEVSGTSAPVRLRSVDGSLRVREVVGDVDARSVDGEVSVTRVRGRVTASSVDEAVRVQGVTGDVTAETTDGDVTLVDVDGAMVEGVTVDGDVRFEGPLHAGGHYRLVTHDGDVTVRVPEGSGAKVTVSTFDGSFSADFPVVLNGYKGGRRMSFTLGDGGADLALESFDGDIRLGWR